jgi:CheY-like chemotaxis protein
VEDLQSLLDDRELSLTLIVEGPVPLNADRARIAQAVSNLVANAVKFTDRGGTVTVLLRAESGGRSARLTVRDTGIGIDGDLLGRIFEPFVQGSRSLGRARGGLGLGLALVKGIVEAHGGSIEARSDGVDRGAEITVRVPMLQHAVAPSGPAPRAAPSATPRKVLIVEDDDDTSESMRRLLIARGHRVELVMDHGSALASVEASQPEVVLCDLKLGAGPDGLQVARDIRGDGERFGKPLLVAITGYGQAEDQARTRAAGFDVHIVKPVDPDRLFKLLDELRV